MRRLEKELFDLESNELDLELSVMVLVKELVKELVMELD